MACGGLLDAFYAAAGLGGFWMKKSKRGPKQPASREEKQTYTDAPQEDAGVEKTAAADSETAREAARNEDAARIGDPAALNAEGTGLTPEEEEAEESESNREDANAPPGEENDRGDGEEALDPLKARKQAERAEKKAQREQAKEQKKEIKRSVRDRKKEIFSRKSDLSGRSALRLARERRRAAKRIETPDINQTGVPHRRHVVRTLLAVAFSFAVIAFVGAYFAFDVPNWQSLDIGKITAAPQTGLMYDGEGELITKIRGSENRVVISLDDIPLHIRQAFLAAEDLRFYQHHGIDFVRLFGALAANIKEGSFAQGASTITMQLIRQSHLSTQKTISRKLEEMWLAVNLERQMSKDEILEMYLNYIYFGNGAYGIQAAAQTYFGVDAQELTLAQAASLAASIKAPSYYAPHVSEKNNTARRNYILDTMLEAGMIAQSEHDMAVAEALAVVEQTPEEIPYGWYVDAVLDEAETLLGLTSDEVLTSGYIIDTALSRTHQDILDNLFTKDLFPVNASDGTPVQGAAACVDTQTGEVMAIVGGRSYDVRRGFNRATQLRRQPGSSLKPLAVYAPAIDQYGYMTASVLKDEPTNFNGYKPRNSGYTYYGNVSIRSALQSSLNVAAVALLNQIGVEAGRTYLQKVGIPLDDRDSNLALALGAMTYGVSPVQLAAAYAPFGNGGTYQSPHFIRRITDSTGRVLYQNRDTGTRVLSEQSAYLMTSLLQSVTSSGTGAKLSAAGTPVAGKTGTVNMTGGGNRDIWMAAYNTEISCAFWMGFDAPDSSHKLQSWVSGGDNTAAMARDFFKAVYQNRSKPSFTRPDGIIALEIDKQAIKWRGEPMLAVDLTPSAYRYTEYFTSDNYPTKKSDVWTPPRSPNNFTIGHNDSGYPVLMIQPADTAVYRIQRDTYGESFVLTELYGGAGETLYYTDTTAKAGVVYTYRVIPVHAELLNNGVLLEGVQAVQVAQANLSGAGGFWQSVKDFFTGGRETTENDAVESMSENQRSIFWSD